MPKTISLNVTDARKSVFDKIAPNLRKQNSVCLEEVTIDECNINDAYFLVFTTQIKSKLGLDGARYVPCNMDGCAITPENLGLLRSDETILLLDHEKQILPFSVSQPINVIPHSNAVTCQTWAYPGNAEHNRAAFALGELVDNSLAATAKNEGPRTIEIRFYDNGPSSFLHILDNGCGMNSEALHEGLRFKAPKELRNFGARNFTSEAELTQQFENDELDSIYPRYINSNISKFGAGMKSCSFFFGGYLRIMTKRKENEAVHDVVLSKSDLERRESSQGAEKVWQTPLKSRNPGTLDESEASTVSGGGVLPWRIKEFIEEEKGKESFTHLLVAELISGDKNTKSPLDVLRQDESKGPSIERQLAHMYHYYIHGREGVGSKENSIGMGQGLVDIIVRRFTFRDGDPVLLSSTNLKDIVPGSSLEDLESKFIRTSEDSFRFTIEVQEFNKTSSDSTFKVGGIIRYHPYHFDGETHPEGLLTRKDTGNGLIADDIDNEMEDENGDGDDGSDDGSGHSNPHEMMQRHGQNSRAPTTGSSGPADPHYSSSASAFNKCKDFFYVWWNGRLIPLVRLESFDWCSPSSKLSPNDPIYKCYDRISGSLFLDSHVDGIAENKLLLSDKDNLMKNFHRTDGIGSKVATLGKIVIGSDGNPKAVRLKNTAKKEFEDWLKNAHKKDKQVKYSGYMGTISKKYVGSTKEYHMFKQAIWDIKLKIGDPIRCIMTKPHIIGTVNAFLLEKYADEKANLDLALLTPKQTVGAPLALVEIEQAPQALYAEEDVLTIKQMGRVDTSATVESIQAAIAQKEKELDMELEFCNWNGPGLEGAEVPIDGIIISTLHMRIKRKDNGSEVPGVIPSASKNKAKKISLAIRCYRCNDDGTRDIHFTSVLCPYYPTGAKGYYFKNIDTKEAEIVEPGNYVLTFWSYVDLSDKAKSSISRKAQTMTLPTARLRRTLTRNGTDEEGDENSEAAADVVPFDECIDELGRHTLKCGAKRIPLPRYDGVNFKVVAGPPHKFTIETFGEDEQLEFKIGVPFDVTLTFEDTKGNPTKPESIESLIPEAEQQLIYVVPASRNSKKVTPELKFLHKDLVLRGDRVVIRNVVVKGVLGTLAHYDCRVAVRLRWKNNRTETCTPVMVRFTPGPPNYVTIAEQTIDVENGNHVYMTCHVKDVCGNMITHTEQKKPFLLACDIFKGKSEAAFDNKRLFRQVTVLASDHTNAPQKLPFAIEMERLTSGEKDKTRLICRVSLENCTHYASVRLNIFPSSRPETLKVYLPQLQANDPQEQELTSLKLKVREVVDNLSFKIFNGRDEEVTRDPSKYTLKFDWPSKTTPSKSAMKTIFETGILPRLVTPSQVIKLKECSITLVNSAPPSEDSIAVELQHKFNLQTVPLDPAELKVNVVGRLIGERVGVAMDEINKLEILVKVVDPHGNLIRDVKENDEIEVEMADIFCIKSSHSICPEEDSEDAGDSNGSFVIRNLEFPITLPALGERDLVIKFRENFQSILPLNFIPGKPTGLAFEIDGDMIAKQEGKKITNHSSPRIKVHLKDSYGNDAMGKDKNVILIFGKKMKGYERPLKSVTNSQGIADFKLVPIGVKPGEVPSACSNRLPNHESCIKKCYNIHLITARCGDISDSCILHITSRSDVPAKLNVHLGPATCTAGSNFEDFYVTLEAEDDMPIVTAKAEDLTLTMTSESSPHGKPGPARVYPLTPISFQEGIYSFGQAPTEAGFYRLEFTYDDGAHRFWTKVNKKFRICSSAVKIMEPLRRNMSGTIFVSNDPEDVGRRTIISGNFPLVLKDEYKNIVHEHLNYAELSSLEENLNGKVKLEITGTFADRVRLENHAQLFSDKIPLNDGVANIPNILLLPENTDIPNKSEFGLIFTATLNDRTVHKYKLNFVFYNDVSQQQERQELEDERKHLEQQLDVTSQKYNLFNLEQINLVNELDKVRRNESAHLNQFPSIIPRDSCTVAHIEAKENFLTNQQRNMESKRCGTCSNINEWDVGKNDKDVLGKIGLLAQVKSEGGGLDADIRLQTIVSWHLQGNLGSVVMLNSPKGIQYSKKYPRMEFMLLDTLPDYNSRWDEDIPADLKPFGNPRYVKSLLHLTPKDQSLIPSVQKVFNVILSRTIIVDTLEDAANFKKAFNQRNRGGSCGTILTRDGGRLSSSGMIGGRNRAPSPGELKYKFGLAPSQDIVNMDAQLKGLRELKDIVRRRVEAEMSLENYKRANQGQMEKLRSELASFKKRKNSVEEKLNYLTQQQQDQSQIFISQTQHMDEDGEVSSSGLGLVTPAQATRRRQSSPENGREALTSKRQRR